MRVTRAAIGEDARHGVINGRYQVFGYNVLPVCDGAAIPADPGVNPSLTITAIAQNAMSHAPPKGAWPRRAGGHAGSCHRGGLSARGRHPCTTTTGYSNES